MLKLSWQVNKTYKAEASSGSIGCTCCSAGAGSGIGRAAALQFANAGCNIVAADINKAAAEETCSLVKGAQQQLPAAGAARWTARTPCQAV
jgi:NAD(P)-dependent dehydrogenase (short-subunit alcohol dehydrogenase family)